MGNWKKVMDLWKGLNPQSNVASPGDGANLVYGEMGKYATVIGPPLRKRRAVVPARRRSAPKIRVALSA